MKRSEIKKGKRYTDGKGNIREVIDIGSQYVLYPGQAECDCLRYNLIAKKSGPCRIGYIGNTTMKSFCAWAKREA